MTFLSLASSSKGNAYIVSDGDTTLLLECGLTLKELRKRAPVPPTAIDAVFVTHEHKDHSHCASQLIRLGIPVYMSEGTARALDLADAYIIEPHEVVEIGALKVTAFDVFHNTAQPFGYAIEDTRTQERLLFAIDTANLNVRIPRLTHIAIECNYMDELLGLLRKLPDKTKDRIRRSHMEIETAIKYLRKIDVSRVETIYLLHMSAGSGDARRFRERFEREFPGINIYICAE